MEATNNSFRDRMTGNPVVVTLLTIGIVSGGLTGLATITGSWEANHTTQVELDTAIQKYVTQPIKEAQQERDEIRQQTSCQNIDILISITEQQIWQMESVGEQSQRLVEKKRELKRLEEKRRTLACTNL